MGDYLGWIRSLPGPAGLLSYPGSYDAPFINWYMYVFTGILPFGHQALCIKSYAMGMLRHPSWLSFGRNMIPKSYLPKDPHDHTPLSDARKEARLFAAMYRDNVLNNG